MLRAKEIEPALVPPTTLTPVGFGIVVVVVTTTVATGTVVDEETVAFAWVVVGAAVVAVVGAVYETRTVGDENVKPVALISTAASVTEMDFVEVFWVPSDSKTVTSNLDAVVMDDPHRQVAISSGIEAS